MKTTIVALAFVFAASLAHATDLKVPTKSTEKNVKTLGAREACLAMVAAECDGKNWTTLGKKACIFVKKRRCK